MNPLGSKLLNHHCMCYFLALKPPTRESSGLRFVYSQSNSDKQPVACSQGLLLMPATPLQPVGKISTGRKEISPGLCSDSPVQHQVWNAKLWTPIPGCPIKSLWKATLFFGIEASLSFMMEVTDNADLQKLIREIHLKASCLHHYNSSSEESFD